MDSTDNRNIEKPTPVNKTIIVVCMISLLILGSGGGGGREG